MKTIPANHFIYEKLNLKPEKSPIYFSGKLRSLDPNTIHVGIIGSRNLSTFTLEFLPGVVEFLSFFKCNIVSGGALGVDTLAHSSALNCGLSTTAFLACPLSQLSPKQNQDLFQNISQKGLLLSYLPPHAQSYKYTFINRNKSLVQLCDFLVVPQAHKDSGTIGTAKFALSQNKMVFVVPMRPTDCAYDGNTILIKQGAKLLTTYNDLFQHPKMLDLLNNKLKPQAEIIAKKINAPKNLQPQQIIQLAFEKVLQKKYPLPD